jgi:large subunit ribosomal protein L4
MKTPTTFTKLGVKATSQVKLNKAVFDNIPETHNLLQQAYTTYLANGRSALAKTKLRGEVRGGGRKPWKQKGTGRARAGSIRSPIWRGGGITFGPTGAENHSKRMHASAKRTALRQSLSLALDSGIVHVIEEIKLKEAKTKLFQQLLDKMHLTGSILVVVNNKNDDLIRATKNISNLVYVQAQYLNVYDVLNADAILIEKEALEIIDTWLGEKR